MTGTARKMSLTQATMLVAGNMIGTGVFLLPANLAQVGGIAIFGWIVATAGVAALGLAFAKLRESRQTHWLAEAFSTLPVPAMTPNAAFQYLVRDEIEHVSLDKLADRVLATSVVPYPPGIPMLMPGESTGANNGPHLGYLRALSAWDSRFPGFGHDTHGVENRDGIYYVQCLKGSGRKSRRA